MKEKIKTFFKKYKIALIIVVVLLVLVFMIVGIINYRKTSYKIIDDISVNQDVRQSTYSIVEKNGKYYICFANILDEIQIDNVKIDGKNVTISLGAGVADFSKEIAPYDSCAIRLYFEPESVIFESADGISNTIRKTSADYLKDAELNLK